MRQVVDEGMQQKENVRAHTIPRFEKQVVYGGLKLALFLLLVVAYPVFIYTHPPIEQPQVNQDTYFELNDIFNIIGTKITLPTDETPAYIQIADLTPFQTEPFFRRALTDDVLVIYEKHKLGILYDPIGKKIINMSTQFTFPLSHFQ